jgi:hypothetical protein
MKEYRRKRGGYTWHFCKNCTNWPTFNYDIIYVKPSSDELCDECKDKERANNCK